MTTPEGKVIDIAKVEDAPDVTRAVLRLPFENKKWYIYDLPGFLSDRRVFENFGRGLLHLQQRPPAVSTFDYIDAAVSPLTYQQIPVEESPFPKDGVVLFFFDPTITPLISYFVDALRAYIDELRSIYGERLIVVATHVDKSAEWDKRDGIISS